MSTYVLVHGAWHGAWCWSRLAPVLQAAGHTVITPDLPGHGTNRMAGRQITAADYIDAIHNLISGLPEPVILVGHSMGGMVISGVAERIPDRIHMLAYLSAFLLASGESINAYEKRVTGSMVAQNLLLSADRTLLELPPAIVREALYAGCNEEDVSFALANLQPQPVRPFLTPIRLTDARFGRVPRIYIECLHDCALPVEAQRAMYQHTRCEAVYTLAAGHAAFYSHCTELAQILLLATSHSRMKQG